MRGRQLCDALQNAVLKLCKERQGSEDWEVDGIICVTLPNIKEQHFVKIHEKFVLNSKDIDGRCFACERERGNISHDHKKNTDLGVFNEPTNQNNLEAPPYRNVSVIDLEHGVQEVDTSENDFNIGDGDSQSNMFIQEAEQLIQANDFSNESSGGTENIDANRLGEYDSSNYAQGSEKRKNEFDTDLSSRKSHRATSQSDIQSDRHSVDEAAVIKDEDYTIVKIEPEDDFEGLHLQCESEDVKLNTTDSSLNLNETQNTSDSGFLLNTSEGASQHFGGSVNEWPYRQSVNKSSHENSSSGFNTEAFGDAASLLSNVSVDVQGDTMRMSLHPGQNTIPSQTISSHQRGAGHQRRKPFGPRIGPRTALQKHSQVASTSKQIGKPNLSFLQYPSFYSDQNETNQHTLDRPLQGRLEGAGILEAKDCLSLGLLDDTLSGEDVSTLLSSSSSLEEGNGMEGLQTQNKKIDGLAAQTVMRRKKSKTQRKDMKYSPFLPPDGKRWPCKNCGMTFSLVGNRNRHQRTTCGLVVYKCNLCNAVFSRSDSKTRHMLTTHGVTFKQ